MPEDLPRRVRSAGRRPFRRTPLTLADLRQQRERLLEIAAAHGIRNIRVFGSVARGEARLDSDVDLLVDIDPGTGVLGPGGFYMDVQDVLEVRPDIVEAAALQGRMRDRVLGEAVPL